VEERGFSRRARGGRKWRLSREIVGLDEVLNFLFQLPAGYVELTSPD
jgi:hypothetical protein